jgi:hypothetical protein
MTVYSALKSNARYGPQSDFLQRLLHSQRVPSAMFFLETDRLLFRSHEPGDEADFVSMHTDPEVRRYVGGRAWPEEEAIRRFRNGYLGRPEKTHGLWATIFKEEQKYIGACGLSAAVDKTAPRLGYYIARPHIGDVDLLRKLPERSWNWDLGACACLLFWRTSKKGTQLPSASSKNSVSKP